MIRLRRKHVDELFGHARESAPAECCGLIGGPNAGPTQSVYRLKNIAGDKLVSYEAAPEDLFAAQRLMRERNEQLIAVYHSHPRAASPEPSETDVRLAYYPRAVYLIIGLGGVAPELRAFRISEQEGLWQQVEYAIAD